METNQRKKEIKTNDETLTNWKKMIIKWKKKSKWEMMETKQAIRIGTRASSGAFHSWWCNDSNDKSTRWTKWLWDSDPIIALNYVQSKMRMCGTEDRGQVGRPPTHQRAWQKKRFTQNDSNWWSVCLFAAKMRYIPAKRIDCFEITNDRSCPLGSPSSLFPSIQCYLQSNLAHSGQSISKHPTWL